MNSIDRLSDIDASRSLSIEVFVGEGSHACFLLPWGD
jgi:hypothetical protein